MQQAEYEQCRSVPEDSSLTPKCNKIALNRGIDRIEFMEKVGRKIELFEDLHLTMLGKQQAFCDRIQRGESMEEMKALKGELMEMVEE